MKGLSISGGGTKIAALAGAVIELCVEKGYKPDIITGISAGSIIAVPLAMGMFAEIEYYSKNFTLNEVFGIKPVTKKGKISFRGLLRAILGKQSFGTQDALLKTFSEIIDPQTFKLYKEGDYAPCYLGAVEFKTGKRVYFNAKEMEYEDYLQAVLASSSIPVFVESVEINGGYYYDGGVRDHIGSHWLMENHKIKEHVSIYSRPDNYDITDLDWCPRNIPTVLTRTMKIMNIEISKNDEAREDELAKKKKIKNKKIFMPHVLAENTYQESPELLEEWFQLGKEATRNQY